ncbi:MAG: DUF3488 domain-containing protein [Nitrospirae bacterium]|nr:DUF3488 domain-containing protein [Nitrospirota bacterium]
MPTLYKFTTALLALTGCISLAVTGEINPLMSISALALLPGYYRFIKGERHAGTALIGTLSVMALAVFVFDALLVSGDFFIAVAHLTITFQALKSFDLKEPWDHLQVYFVSLLQLIIASELTSALAFGVIFVFFMLLLVTAMVLSHFMKEGRMSGLSLKKPVMVMSFLTVVVTVVFFVALPRTPYRFLGKTHIKGIKTSGFSEQMDFGSLSSIKLDPSVIARVELSRDFRGPYYWRGHTLDHFDGKSWRNTLKDRRRIYRSAADEFILSDYDRAGALGQTFYLEPIDSDVLFSLEQARGVRADAYAIYVDTAESIYVPGKRSRRIKYTAYSIPGAEYPGSVEKAYIQLPSDNKPVADLAKSVTAGLRTDAERASAVERYLRNSYTYSLTLSPSAGGVNPVEEFLLRTKKGYCEHYAAGMVIMLRSLGVPARVVTGFYGGEKNEYGDYTIIRSSDAHSWVEALIGGSWKRFDPTPPVSNEKRQAYALVWDSVEMAWARYVVGFSYKDQRFALNYLATNLDLRRLPNIFKPGQPGMKSDPYIIPVLGLFTLIVYLFYRLWAWYRGRKRYGPLTSEYVAIRRMLAKKGIRIAPSSTSGDVLSVTRQYHFNKDLSEFIALYEGARFGRKDPDALIKKADVLLQAIKKSGLR